MQAKNKAFLMLSVGVAAICLFAVLGLRSTEETREAIQLPEKAIETIQINGIKVHASRSGSWDFERFAQSLENVRPLESEKKQWIKRGELYYVVTLRYEDRTKESFYFFQNSADETKWYVETEDGFIFQDAEFFTQYVNRTSVIASSDVASNGKLEIPDPDSLKSLILLNMKLKELGIVYSTTDLRAAFAMEMQLQLGKWNTMQEAAQAVRAELVWKMDQYQYAVCNGYALTQEELDVRMEEQDMIIKSASNFEEMELYYKECGTTYDTYSKDLREYSRIQFTIEKLKNSNYEEFRHGNDQIGDTICENAVEYWTSFLLDVVYPATETYNEENLIPLLDKAEEFYFEHFGET